MSEALKPCPFCPCGGDPKMRTWDFPYIRYQVRCAKCKAATRSRLKTWMDAETAWNTRAALSDTGEDATAAVVGSMVESELEERIEAAYWFFDARRSGYGEFKGAPQSERDAYKQTVRNVAYVYVSTIQNLQARIAELESKVLLPGVMRCAKCDFRLIRHNVYAASGTITAGDSNTEPCPNGCGPLWPVTEREERVFLSDMCDKYAAQNADLERQLSEARVEVKQAGALVACSERLPASRGVYIAFSGKTGRSAPRDGVDALYEFNPDAGEGKCQWQHASGFYDNGVTHWLDHDALHAEAARLQEEG